MNWIKLPSGAYFNRENGALVEAYREGVSLDDSRIIEAALDRLARGTGETDKPQKCGCGSPLIKTSDECLTCQNYAHFGVHLRDPSVPTRDEEK